jgi:hypothetical protein
MSPDELAKLRALQAERDTLRQLMVDDERERTTVNTRALDRLDRRIARLLSPPDRRTYPARRCEAPGCDEWFTPNRIDQRYHSAACKQRAWRADHGANTRWTAKGTS